MPGRKKPSVGEWTVVLDEMRRHGVILEEMRSQNRATIEVVEARYESLTQRFDDAQEETNERFAVVEGSIRSLAEETRRRDEGLAAALQQVDDRSRARDEALAAQIREVDEGSRTRDEALALQIREVDAGSRARDEHLEVTLRELKVNVLENGVDLRALAGKVEALSRIEDRVTALEKRAR
jgi:hypothetical protein